jgi:YD repeat-containing protein
MKKLIKRILREEINKSDRHYRMLDKISEYVQLPYFESMEGLTIYDKDDQLYIMKKILGNDIYIRGDVIRIDNGNEIYYEDSVGFWQKREYDDKGNLIYIEDSDGYWEKYEYDDNGNYIYWEDSDGRIIDNR